MFHEIFLAPLKQTKKFRSPDVALFPFVALNTRRDDAVVDAWRLGGVVGFCDRSNHGEHDHATAASSFVDGDRTISAPSLFSSGGG